MKNLLKKSEEEENQKERFSLQDFLHPGETLVELTRSTAVRHLLVGRRAAATPELHASASQIIF